MIECDLDADALESNRPPHMIDGFNPPVLAPQSSAVRNQARVVGYQQVFVER
jgi:hypothetical protein